MHASAHPDGGDQAPRCGSGHVGGVCSQMETCAGKLYFTFSPKITGRGKKRAVESLKHPMARRTSRWKDPRFYFIFLNDQSSLTLCVCLCLNLEFNSRLCRVKLQTGSPSGDLALLQSNSYMFPYRPHLDLCLYVCFSCKVIRLQLASIWQRVFFFFSKSSAGKLYS